MFNNIKLRNLIFLFIKALINIVMLLKINKTLVELIN